MITCVGVGHRYTFDKKYQCYGVFETLYTDIALTYVEHGYIQLLLFTQIIMSVCVGVLLLSVLHRILLMFSVLFGFIEFCWSFFLKHCF